MSLAIKYAMKKKSRKMADGGDVEETSPPNLDPAGVASLKRAFHTPAPKEKEDGYAEGGFIAEEEASGYEDEPSEEDDMAGKIMKKRYARGGAVANDTGMGAEADLEDNEFDDLVKSGGMEGPGYTGANSGDEIGDAAEDQDRRDIVSMVMNSRKKKDRLPNPR